MASIYSYELRRGDEIVATGHLTNEEPLQVGQPLSIGSRKGVIQMIQPVLRASELRLVVQLHDESLRPYAARIPARCFFVSWVACSGCCHSHGSAVAGLGARDQVPWRGARLDPLDDPGKPGAYRGGSLMRPAGSLLRRLPHQLEPDGERLERREQPKAADVQRQAHEGADRASGHLALKLAGVDENRRYVLLSEPLAPLLAVAQHLAGSRHHLGGSLRHRDRVGAHLSVGIAPPIPPRLRGRWPQCRDVLGATGRSSGVAGLPDASTAVRGPG